jgi:hypothetical protein
MISVVTIPVRLTRLGQKEKSMALITHKLNINKTIEGRKFTYYVEQRGNLMLEIEGMKTCYLFLMQDIAETIIKLRKKNRQVDGGKVKKNLFPKK